MRVTLNCATEGADDGGCSGGMHYVYVQIRVELGVRIQSAIACRADQFCPHSKERADIYVSGVTA